MLAVPEGKEEKTELEVFNFTGAGGVALSMYNTDEVWFLDLLSISVGDKYLDCWTKTDFPFSYLMRSVYPFFCWGFHEHCIWEKVATLS